MSSRRLRRFFTPDAIQAQGTVCLPPADTDHLRRTLRLKEGDSCLVTNGEGLEAEAVVSDLGSSQAKLLIQKVLPRRTGRGFKLFVYPAFIQKGKMDELVRQMQELGVQGFFPLETERTVVKMTADAKEKVAERWEKITQEAAKQSGSLEQMNTDGPRSLKDVLERLPANGALVVFHPDKKAVPFKEWIAKTDPQKSLHLFFGPEGGFSEKEAALLESRGAVRVGLGETILKADTAVLGTAAALKFLSA